MSDEFSLDIDDIAKIRINELLGNNIPSIDVQKAMVEEIERLRDEGKSDAESIRLVFEHNKELH